MSKIQIEEQVEEMPEQKLWRAVIASTVQEWIHGPLRQQREAEQFLFNDNQDYRTVCYSAGIDPAYLRNRLEKFRSSKDASRRERNSRKFDCFTRQISTARRGLTQPSASAIMRSRGGAAW